MQAPPSSSGAPSPLSPARADSNVGGTATTRGETALSHSRPRCRITAHEWDTVAVWSWNVQMRVCAICKGNLADRCINCLAKTMPPPAEAAGGSSPASPSSASPVATSPANAATQERGRATATVTFSPPNTAATSSTPATLADLAEKCCVGWGTCGHVFHYHCMSRWLQMRTVCPVCGLPWQLHKVTSNE